MILKDVSFLARGAKEAGKRFPFGITFTLSCNDECFDFSD